MKVTRKVLPVLLTLAMVLTFFCGLTTTAYAEETPTTGIRMEAVREGDTIKLNIISNEELNFGGIGFASNPTCNVSGVFSYNTMDTDVANFTCTENPADDGMPMWDTAKNITLPANTTLLYFVYDIDTTKFTEGTEYTFTLPIDMAYPFDTDNLELYRSWYSIPLTATYKEEASTFTITWNQDDGTLIDTTTVNAGEVPTHADATKDADAQYTYTFAGWDPTPVAAMADATYTATYDKTVNTYTVTWKNYDGTVLETDENVAYGTTPSYDGETPVKPADETNTYTFTGWDPAVAPVEGDVEYTAQFSSEEITYWTLTFKDAEGNVVAEKQVADGQKLTDIPTVEAPEGQYLKGWTIEAKFMGFINLLRETPAVFDFANTPITSSMTFVPVFENKGVDLSSIVITKVLAGDEYDGDEPVTFNFVITPVNGAPAIEGTFTVSTDGTLTVALPENAIFDEGGNFTYEVTEDIPADPGDWTYDTTKYIMELLIEEQNPDGKLGLTYAKIHKDGETDKSATLEFTNTYKIEVAPLTIKNTNSDNVVEGTKFAYSIVFDATFTDGQTTYTANQSVDLGELGDDESVTINNIPVGTGFTVTETTGGTMYSHKMVKGEIVSDSNSVAMGEDLVMTGTIVADPNAGAKADTTEPANYIEVLNDLIYETGTLKITKEVEGEIDPAYSDKEFSFTITFTVPEEFANIKIQDKDGVDLTSNTVTFTLKAGESYDSFTNIPVGTTYTLTEAAEQYYIATYETENGDEGGNTEANKAMEAKDIVIVKDENAITVTNTYTITPPTGVTIHTEMILILALVLVAMIGSVVLTKKLRRA